MAVAATTVLIFKAAKFFKVKVAAHPEPKTKAKKSA
jgi:hypothetical protein